MFSRKLSDFQFPDNNDEEEAESFMKNYDNQKEAVEMHIDILFNLPFISKSSSELHKLLNIILSSLSTLEAWGYRRDKLSDLFLVKTIISKLDVETQSLIENFKDSYGLPSCNELIKFLFKRIHVLKSFEISKHILEANSRQSIKFRDSDDEYNYKGSCGNCPDLLNLTKKPMDHNVKYDKVFQPVRKKSEIKRESLEDEEYQMSQLQINDPDQDPSPTGKPQHTMKIHHKPRKSNKDLLLSTAIVLVNDNKGLSHCRTLLDSTDTSFFFTNYPNFL